jgi:hypothetical protein
MAPSVSSVIDNFFQKKIRRAGQCVHFVPSKLTTLMIWLAALILAPLLLIFAAVCCCLGCLCWRCSGALKCLLRCSIHCLGACGGVLRWVFKAGGEPLNAYIPLKFIPLSCYNENTDLMPSLSQRNEWLSRFLRRVCLASHHGVDPVSNPACPTRRVHTGPRHYRGPQCLAPCTWPRGSSCTPR